MADIKQVSAHSHLTTRARIKSALDRAYPSGLTRTAINKKLNFKISSADIARALQALMDAGQIRGEEVRTQRRGRPKEVWYKK